MVLTSKYVGTGPSSYEKRIYRPAVSQRLRNTALRYTFLMIVLMMMMMTTTTTTTTKTTLIFPWFLTITCSAGLLNKSLVCCSLYRCFGIWRGDIWKHILCETNHPCDGIAILPPTTVVQVKKKVTLCWNSCFVVGGHMFDAWLKNRSLLLYFLNKPDIPKFALKLQLYV